MTKLNLTKEQKAHLKTVLWLTDPVGFRAQGRSSLMALAYVIHARNNPGSTVYMRDHCPTRDCDERMIPLVKDLFDPSEHWKVGHNWIQFEGAKPDLLPKPNE